MLFLQAFVAIFVFLTVLVLLAHGTSFVLMAVDDIFGTAATIIVGILVISALSAALLALIEWARGQ